MRARWAVLLAIPLCGLAALLATAGPATGREASRAATINFSFQGYANNIRVRPPLVGAFQLGTAKIHGSGTLTATGIDGTLVDTTDPLLDRYPTRWVRAKFIGYKFFQAAHSAYTKITLTVEVTRTSHPSQECAPGTRGTLTIYDSAATLSNGQPSDYVTLGHWDAQCATFVQGWTNADGGARTKPPNGGPPSGGQWAIVRTS